MLNPKKMNYPAASCGVVHWVAVKKLSKYLTQTFMSHGNEMLCQPVMLSGYAEWPKVADAVIEAQTCARKFLLTV